MTGFKGVEMNDINESERKEDITDELENSDLFEKLDKTCELKLERS
jgi:hypothetical protein